MQLMQELNNLANNLLTEVHTNVHEFCKSAEIKVSTKNVLNASHFKTF